MAETQRTSHHGNQPFLCDFIRLFCYLASQSWEIHGELDPHFSEFSTISGVRQDTALHPQAGVATGILQLQYFDELQRCGINQEKME